MDNNNIYSKNGDGNRTPTGRRYNQEKTDYSKIDFNNESFNLNFEKKQPTERTPQGRPVSSQSHHLNQEPFDEIHFDSKQKDSFSFENTDNHVSRDKTQQSEFLVDDTFSNFSQNQFDDVNSSDNIDDLFSKTAETITHTNIETSAFEKRQAPQKVNVNIGGYIDTAEPAVKKVVARNQNEIENKKRDTKMSKKRKKANPTGKFIKFALLICFFAVIASFFYGYSILGEISYDTDFLKENEYIDDNLLFADSKIENILFIGSDARSEIGGARSDTMMLFSIDKKNNQIKLTSFLRDSYVYIPSKQFNTKLNASFAYGGAQLAIDTIEYNFKVNIDKYVMVDFSAFEQLVNAIGGITIDDVSEKEANYMNNVVKIKEKKLTPGTNTMNGNTALWYCRIRYIDSDFQRTQRQQKVIKAIVKKASETNFTELVDAVKLVLPNISTSISRNELLALATGAVGYMTYDIHQMQIPVKGTWSDATINGAAVLKMDIDENARLLQEFLETEQVAEEEKE